MDRVTSKFRLFAVVFPLLVALTGCSSRDVQSGLTEQEAQEIVVILKQNGLDASTAREKQTSQDAAPAWTVQVRGGSRELLTAWQVLQENGLPRQKVKGLEEVFSSKGMIPTAGEEKARMLLALSGELTRMIKSVSGVVDARVQVVLPDNSPLLDKSQWSPPTASVLVKHRGASPPLSEDEVRRLVARGVEGLQPENVAVVYKRVNVTPPSNQEANTFLNPATIAASALGLALLTSAGSLLLVFRSRKQRATISALKKELEAASSPPQQQFAEGGRG